MISFSLFRPSRWDNEYVAVVFGSFQFHSRWHSKLGGSAGQSHEASGASEGAAVTEELPAKRRGRDDLSKIRGKDWRGSSVAQVGEWLAEKAGIHDQRDDAGRGTDSE